MDIWTGEMINAESEVEICDENYQGPGEIVWSKYMTAEYSSNPVLLKVKNDILYFSYEPIADHSSKIVAVNINDGSLIFEENLKDLSIYIYSHHKQVFFDDHFFWVFGKDHVLKYDLNNGALLERYDFEKELYSMSLENGKFIATSVTYNSNNNGVKIYLLDFANNTVALEEMYATPLVTNRTIENIVGIGVSENGDEAYFMINERIYGKDKYSLCSIDLNTQTLAWKHEVDLPINPHYAYNFKLHADLLLIKTEQEIVALDLNQQGKVQYRLSYAGIEDYARITVVGNDFFLWNGVNCGMQFNMSNGKIIEKYNCGDLTFSTNTNYQQLGNNIFTINSTHGLQWNKINDLSKNIRIKSPHQHCTYGEDFYGDFMVLEEGMLLVGDPRGVYRIDLGDGIED